MSAELEDFFHCEHCGQPINPDDGFCYDCDPFGDEVEYPDDTY